MATALPSSHSSPSHFQLGSLFGAQKLGLGAAHRRVSVARAGGDGGGGGRGSVRPVYTPTPPDRELRTPHSGYHFDGSARQFFEGWYFKVSIPEVKQSFCFMYSVENPAFTRKLNSLEEAQYGRKFTGVGAQILGADDKYICQYAEESQNFWGSRNELILGNAFATQNKLQPPNKEIPPEVRILMLDLPFQL
ncbi:Tocopherol cyclase, chloroplastic-like protein [Drosera capensis]